MKRASVIPAALALFFMLSLTGAGQSAPPGDELPLHTQKLGDKVLFAWVGDAMQTIRVVALSTARGVVVIEANLMRSADARIRRAIEEAFGRKDVKYLINTHFHHDHTAGNQVYADATIIGHRSVPEGMKGELTGEGLIKKIGEFKGMVQDWGERQKKAAPDSRDFLFFREGVALLKTTIAELQEGFSPTFPSVLFDKSLVLDMGDMTVELYSVGGTHTKSDIMIFIPEEGLVAIGDMWPDQMLPYLSKQAPWDLAAILESWGRIVDSGREIKQVNMAHSDMKLGVETFKQQYRYLKTLWEGLKDMRAGGFTLEDAKKKYTIEKDFPYFKDRMLKIRDLNLHENNMEAIWERAASAPRELIGFVPRPSGPYLGQKTPGTTPEIFASGIVSTGLAELNSVFSPDGTEFYFCVRNMGASSLFMMKSVRGVWGKPEPLPFAGPYDDIDVSLSPDGQQLFFCSNRPISGGGSPKGDYDIWMCERKGETWGPPAHLGDAVNSPRDDFFPIVTNSKTLYFNSQRAGAGTNDIYFCRWADGKYAPAEKLGPEINSESREFDAFVAPDESFVIFTSERPGEDRFGDLYISFKSPGGKWTPAQNMGKGINAVGPEYGTTLSPDGKYLLFTRQSFPRVVRDANKPLTVEDYLKMHTGPENGSTDIWWVDARIIDGLRAKTEKQ